MLENGMEQCNCKRVKCERHGNCVECLEHHKLHKKHPPFCIRGMEKAKQKTKTATDK